MIRFYIITTTIVFGLKGLINLSAYSFNVKQPKKELLKQGQLVDSVFYLIFAFLGFYLILSEMQHLLDSQTFYSIWPIPQKKPPL